MNNSNNHQRILILSGGGGTGHIQAGKALEKELHHWPNIDQVDHFDALDYTQKPLKDLYSKLYIQLTRNAPDLLSWWYDTSDEPWKTDDMRLLMDRLNAGPLVDLISKYKPDVTICTHSLPAEIVSDLISRKKLSTQLSIVVTDFTFHAMWLSKAFHRYFVATEEIKVHLKMLGFPEKYITVSGIPIDSSFCKNPDRHQLRKQFHLQENMPTLLISAGALGVSPLKYIISNLLHLKHPAQIIVICGKNEDMKKQITQQINNIKHTSLSFKILGYTKRMADWMAVSDIFIGKPGGLTSSEVLARGLPMVIFSPIPGQEERNSDYLLENGAAIRCNEPTTIAYKVDRLLGNPENLNKMKNIALNLSRPDAANTIISTLLKQTPKNPAPVKVKKNNQKNVFLSHTN